MLRDRVRQLQLQLDSVESKHAALAQKLTLNWKGAEEQLRRKTFQLAEARHELDAAHRREIGGVVTVQKDDNGYYDPLGRLIMSAVDAARPPISMPEAAFRELCESTDDAETGRGLKTWSLSGWLASCGACDVLAGQLLARLRRTDGRAPALERAFAVALGRSGTKEMVRDLLDGQAAGGGAPLLERLAETIWGAAQALGAQSGAAPAASAADLLGATALRSSLSADVAAGLAPPTPLGAKFWADGGAGMSVAAPAAADALHAGGLAAVLPLPAWREGGLIADVQREHCAFADARKSFVDEEHGISTTSEIE